MSGFEPDDMDFSYLIAGSCRDLGAFSRLYGILSGSRVLDSAALLSTPPPNGLVKRHRESLPPSIAERSACSSKERNSCCDISSRYSVGLHPCRSQAET